MGANTSIESHDSVAIGDNIAVGKKADKSVVLGGSYVNSAGKTVNTKVDARQSVVIGLGNTVKSFTLDSENGNTDSNVYNTVIGTGNVMEGTAAIGDNSQVKQSTAIGYENTVASQNSVAIGSGNKAMGTYSVALGGSAEALKGNTLAIGQNAKAMAEHALAVGFGAQAGVAIDKVTDGSLATDSIAFGVSATTNSADSISIGHSSKIGASARGSIAIGNSAVVSDSLSDSIVMGRSASATGNGYQAVAIGTQASVTTSGGVALGDRSVANVTNGKKAMIRLQMHKAH